MCVLAFMFFCACMCLCACVFMYVHDCMSVYVCGGEGCMASTDSRNSVLSIECQPTVDCSVCKLEVYKSCLLTS